MVNLTLPRGTSGTVHTVLSVLHGEHSLGKGILGFFSMKEARTLRLVCEEFREAIAETAWHDKETRITFSTSEWMAAPTWQNKEEIVAKVLSNWHTSFPHAKAAYVDMPLRDEQFKYFHDFHSLKIKSCYSNTNTAMTHLRGIRHLEVENNGWIGHGLITDDAFAHLQGIHTLNIRGFRRITKAFLEHLRGIHTLEITNCPGITAHDLVLAVGINTFIYNEYKSETDNEWESDDESKNRNVNTENLCNIS
jgi:hypothetical protein